MRGAGSPGGKSGPSDSAPALGQGTDGAHGEASSIQIARGCGSQSGARPALWASPSNLLEIRILGPHPNLQTLGMGPRSPGVIKPSGRLPSSRQFEKCCPLDRPAPQTTHPAPRSHTPGCLKRVHPSFETAHPVSFVTLHGGRGGSGPVPRASRCVGYRRSWGAGERTAWLGAVVTGVTVAGSYANAGRDCVKVSKCKCANIYVPIQH